MLDKLYKGYQYHMFEDGAILPEDNPAVRVLTPSPKLELVLSISRGLVKRGLIEDRVGWRRYGDDTARLLVADGHWGELAAEAAVEYWMYYEHAECSAAGWRSVPRPFPTSSREQAVAAAKGLEELIVVSGEEWDPDTVNPKTSRPPETAFIAAEITGLKSGQNGLMRYVSYGDCRAFVATDRPSTEWFRSESLATWLGAFSVRGKRNRLTVEEGVRYGEVTLAPGHLVFLCSDGVPEARYKKPTISEEQIAACFQDTSVEFGAYNLLGQVGIAGAQDHTSFIALRF
jgi:serine/threonine protein phosphatase PrpC